MLYLVVLPLPFVLFNHNHIERRTRRSMYRRTNHQINVCLLKWQILLCNSRFYSMNESYSIAYQQYWASGQKATRKIIYYVVWPTSILSFRHTFDPSKPFLLHTQSSLSFYHTISCPDKNFVCFVASKKIRKRSLGNVFAKSFKKVRDNDSSIAVSRRDIGAVPMSFLGCGMLKSYIGCSKLHPYSGLIIKQKVHLIISRNKTIAKVQVRITLLNSPHDISPSFIISILHPRISLFTALCFLKAVY